MSADPGEDHSFAEALVEGYEPLMPVLTLPDPKDVHVLAAAIHGKADAIVTYNLKDFPVDVAARHSIEVKHPDDFIVNVIDLDTAKALTAIGTSRPERGSSTSPLSSIPTPNGS